MNVNLFMLMALEDESKVVAIGMHIIAPDGREDVVTVRRDPGSEHMTVVQSASPERARQVFNMMVPVQLKWVTAEERDFTSQDSRSCTSLRPPRTTR